MASSNNNWLGLDNEISTAQIYGDLPSDGNTSSQDWKMINQDMTPKLENFLGHSFCDGGGDNYHGVSGGGGTMGLSMIKHWLRSNPAATESKALSLSMSTGSQSSTAAPLLGAGAEEQNKLQQCAAVEGGVAAEEAAPRKSVETFGQRTSIYRGVTRHRWTGRYEAHLWDNSCRREGQTRKGRQVYLGGYDKEDKAARSYDLAALKYWGTTTTTNFPMSNYEKEIEEMKHMTRQEYVASLRRKSSGFSRGASMYRGVTRHHQHGRWQARIGRVAGNKDLYLGTFSTQEEAAEAYDVAAIKFRGLNAVTNFEINRYDVKSILESPTLPIGGAAKRLKEAENAEVALEMHRANEANTLNLQLLTDHTHINSVYASGYDHNSNTWPTIAFQQPQPMMSVENYPFALQKPMWCKQEHDSGDVISHGYNFMQTNIVGIDSSGSNSGNNGFGIPMMGIAENGVHHHQNQHGNVGFVGMNDHDHEESLYYHQFQQSSGNWSHIPTAVPTVAGRSNGLSFTGWNNS